jgi:hypothetical protein
MSIQTVQVFHNSKFIFEMKLISFAFVQVIQLRAVFAVVIAKHKNSFAAEKALQLPAQYCISWSIPGNSPKYFSSEKRNIPTFPRVIAFRNEI